MCLGVPGQIIEIIDAKQQLARVDIAGIRRPVNIACVLNDSGTVEECVGAWVLVHVGFAMSQIDEEEAQKTLELLAQLGDLQEEQTAMREGEK